MEKEQIITIPLTKIIYAITTSYILLIAVVLPLYHRDGFCFIGDRKYRLFFMASIIMVPVILLLILAKHLAVKERIVLSVTDLCAIGYGCIVSISSFMSSYRQTAIWGYEDWHMGTVTQLLFVGIYFVVSRGWKWHRGTVLAICVSSGIICLLGVMNRFAIDPLQMFEGLEYWNKTHLLATIGNINWYCSYVCVVFPMGLYYFWMQPVKTKHLAKKIVTLFYISIAFATLITQGSESGIVALGAVFLAYSYFSLESQDKIYRFLQMNLILGITVCMVGILYRIADKEQIYFASDLAIEKILLQPIWWLYSGIVAVLLIRLKLSDTFQTEKYQRIWRYCLIGLFFLTGVIGLLHTMNTQFLPFLNQISILHINKNWGSGRGLLWYVVGKAYIEMPLIKQLFGVGADCFAPYLYEHYGQLLDGFLAEWWGNALVANAHNEWLNVLINNGILGIVSYMGIFMTAIYRWIRSRKNVQVLIALAICVMSYMVNNTVSFQQVVSTPIVFTLLGMGENLLKKNARN